MFNYNNIISLVKKDVLLEIRNQYSFYGVVLYAISTTFVIYLTIGEPENIIWNALFWIVALFVCINYIAKSFLAESYSRYFYYYSIVHPNDFIIAKIIYNIIFMLIINSLQLILFLVFLNNPFQHIAKFLGISFLGGLGISLIFTFLAALSSKAKQNASIMAVLGLPIIIPQLILITKVSNIAYNTVVQEGLGQMICLLILLDVLVIMLSIILFKYLWKD